MIEAAEESSSRMSPVHQWPVVRALSGEAKLAQRSLAMTEHKLTGLHREKHPHRQSQDNQLERVAAQRIEWQPTKERQHKKQEIVRQSQDNQLQRVAAQRIEGQRTKER
mmetsp:Transcript_7459/g.13850  ORF Transcript_7459/g.13850 Transcript_7459/m.13850 type:complete len:109 (+) Transcript_7459:849-1175(+)